MSSAPGIYLGRLAKDSSAMTDNIQVYCPNKALPIGVGQDRLPTASP